jgi:hypothetical protein
MEKEYTLIEINYIKISGGVPETPTTLLWIFTFSLLPVCYYFKLEHWTLNILFPLLLVVCACMLLRDLR